MWEAIDHQHGGTMWRRRNIETGRYEYCMTRDWAEGTYQGGDYHAIPQEPNGCQVFTTKGAARQAYIAQA